MNQIVALWTHPRSISTAFERVMMERGDYKILHEPFSYLYYVDGDSASINQQYVDLSHPTDYAGIKDLILTSSVDGQVFFKDMCAHCNTYLAQDDQLLKRLTNTFLIRDPAKTIASFYAMNPNVSLEEIGLEQLCEVFDRVSEQAGEVPIVVDADDLEDDPHGTIRAYCLRLGIPFLPEAMSWKAEHKEEWDIWKDWHKDAAESSGIVKNMEQFEVTVENSDHLRGYYDRLLPFYQRMYSCRIKPVTPQ